MKGKLGKLLFATGIILTALIGWKYFSDTSEPDQRRPDSQGRAIPVETAEVTRGSIDEIRTYSGTLIADARLNVASKISGRVQKVHADLADEITSGQLLVTLESDDIMEALAVAEAEVEVAAAEVNEMKSLLSSAEKEKNRMQELAKRGISSSADLERTENDYTLRKAGIDVASANLKAKTAARNRIKVQLDESNIRAHWQQEDEVGYVANRNVEQGETVSPQDTLFTLVTITPVRAVIYVPEKEYGRLSPGQSVRLNTDAWPDRSFPATISRIAPVFDVNSRQAKVEIVAENEDRALKPGMFIRAEIILDHVENATLIPAKALTRRGSTAGIFLVDPQTKTARWQEVTPGIRQGSVVQLLDTDIEGDVVTLGQQFLDEGSPLLLPEMSGSQP